jgi:hypothetical protein
MDRSEGHAGLSGSAGATHGGAAAVVSFKRRGASLRSQRLGGISAGRDRGDMAAIRSFDANENPRADSRADRSGAARRRALDRPAARKAVECIPRASFSTDRERSRRAAGGRVRGARRLAPRILASGGDRRASGPDGVRMRSHDAAAQDSGATCSHPNVGVRRRALGHDGPL